MWELSHVWHVSKTVKSKVTMNLSFTIPLGGRSISPDVSPIKFGLWACTLCLYMGLEVLVILGASGL